MKIVLVSFSQDTNILNPEESENFIVVGDEDSRETVRIPVPFETIKAIAVFVDELNSRAPMEVPEEEFEPKPDEPGEEPEAVAPPAPEDVVPAIRKRLTQAAARPGQVLRRASAAVQPLPQSEDEVPSI
jgi:hypothetical protein